MLYVIVICVLYLLPLFWFNLLSTEDLFAVLNICFAKLKHFLNKIKLKFSTAMEPISQSNENSLNDSNQDLDESVYSLKMFQFERIRCKNLKTDNKYLTTSGGNMTYEVPSKRSGHRAVCDDENLWTWGGFCPTPGDQEESNPMLPEVMTNS